VVIAFDAESGEERWRAERDEPTSWATPVFAQVDGKTQVIVSGTKKIRAYDLGSGALVWQCDGLSNNVVATPVVADGMLVAGSSYERQAMVAIRLAGARGEVSGPPQLAWVRRRSTPYVPSPLVLGEWLYFLNHYQGFLCRVALQTGEEPDRPLRIADLDAVYASPVAAADRIYLLGRNGLAVVLRAGAPPVELARNVLSDSFSATPALVEGELYLRGDLFLYCIADDESADGER
jgi:outer membrane protein assembly factor BamB